jgi:hypothetical protein
VGLKQTQYEYVGWIQVVWVRVQWQSLVNMVTELQIMHMGKLRNLLTSVGLCSVQLIN